MAEENDYQYMDDTSSKDNVYQKGINRFLDKTSLAVARSYPRFVRYNFVRFIVRYLLPK